MARGNTAPAEDVVVDETMGDVDTPENDELDTVDTNEVTESAPKAAKKESSRPPVPEGYVTPIGFAHALTKRIRETNPEAEEIRPQVIYSYIKNGSKEDPLKTYELGGRQNLLVLDEAFAWWDRKAERVAKRKESAAEKAAKKAAKAEAGGEEAEGAEPQAEATEVE